MNETEYMEQCVKNMVRILKTDRDLLQWFINYNPSKETGYVFCNHPNYERLSALTDSDGHSGASFAICCRIAKERLTSSVP